VYILFCFLNVYVLLSVYFDICYKLYVFVPLMSDGVQTDGSSDGLSAELSVGIAVTAVGLLIAAIVVGTVVAVMICSRYRLRTTSGDATLYWLHHACSLSLFTLWLQS